MHERLSASTDLRPARPDVAKDRSGLGRARAGIVSDEVLDSGPTGGDSGDLEREILRCTPSTKARNRSSGGEGNRRSLRDGLRRCKAVGGVKMRDGPWLLGGKRMLI